MNSITPEQAAIKQQLIQELRAKAEKVTSVVKEYNTWMNDIRTMVDEALDDYNDTLPRVKKFLSTTVKDINKFINLHQDNSDIDVYEDWKSDWELIAYDDIDVEIPLDLEVPDMSLADEIESIPNSIEK